MKSVLLVLAGTRTPDEAIEHAAQRARGEGARLVALYVLGQEATSDVFDTFTDIGFIGDKPSTELSESLMKDFRQRGYEELGRAQIKAMEVGVDFEPVFVQGDYVGSALEAVEKYDATVVVASRSRKKHLISYFSKTPADELKAGCGRETVLFDDM